MPGDALALCRFTRDGAVSVLHSFGTPQGPAPGLLVGRDGHVYGLSVGDGTNKSGTFYRFIPGGDFSILHHFGPEEYAGSHLIQHSDGAFYGATWVGSVAFRVTTNGDFSVIARFRSGVCSTMVEAGDGNLYALIAGDPFPFLALCRLVPDGEGTVLHRFDYGELLPPLASAMTSRDGQVYGLTRDTVYRLTADDQLATVHQFDPAQDRSRPRWGLTQHSDNAWYGVTEYGGEWGLGTVFRITPEGAYGRGGFHSPDPGTGPADRRTATASGGRCALHPSAASRGGECREPAFTNKCTTATNLEGLSSLSY